MPPTIAALESAARAGDLAPWLALLPADGRDLARRALELDRDLWTEHPASLAGCLLARVLAVEALADLCAAWTRELDARAAPWVRPLRALPVAPGLLAELHARAARPLAGLHVLDFPGDDEVTLTAPRDPHDPTPRRRLRWRWAAGDVAFDHVDEPAPPPYPKFDQPQWGPSYLVRAPGAAPIRLPCPDDGTASAAFSPDGARLFVYGAHDEYAGGFVDELDPDTLAVRRHLDTPAPVSGVRVCRRPELLLLDTYRGALLVDGAAARPLPIRGSAALSPSGDHLATWSDGLRVWSRRGLERADPPSGPGFRPRFDPSGDRLLADDHLYDGRTGAPVARLRPEVGHYLEGGPASPALHVGERHVIHLAGVPQVWDTRTGAPRRPAARLQYPHWNVLAYDRAGERMAVLHFGDAEVVVHALPRGRVVRTLTFDLAGEALALSPDGARVAVQRGRAVEVRDAGGVVLRAGDPADPPSRRGRPADGTLRFSADGARLARWADGDGWRIWSLDGADERHLPARDDLAGLDGFAPPHPRDWTIDPGTCTRFHHRPTGTTIALPAAGPWVWNPADPHIGAAGDLHIELRDGAPGRTDPPT